MKRNKSLLEKLLYHTVAGHTTIQNYDLRRWPIFTIRFPLRFRAWADFFFFVELDLLIPLDDPSRCESNFSCTDVLAPMLFSEWTYSSLPVFEVYQSCDIASLSPTSPFSNEKHMHEYFWMHISSQISLLRIIDTFSSGPVHNLPKRTERRRNSCHYFFLERLTCKVFVTLQFISWISLSIYLFLSP